MKTIIFEHLEREREREREREIRERRERREKRERTFTSFFKILSPNYLGQIIDNYISYGIHERGQGWGTTSAWSRKKKHF